MRRIVMLNRISIDGFFAGPNGEIDWFVPDPDVDKAVHNLEVDKATHEMMHLDTILFGRVTYEMFERHWPKVAADPTAPKEARATADELSHMTKVVFSNTLKEVTWKNSRLVKGNVPEEVRKLKQGRGPGMIIFGSGTIVQQLAAERLIDEYLIIVTPVILGTGKPLFRDVKRFNLRLLETRAFQSGNVLLHYETDKEEMR
ncbi:MAG: deaminase [Candidatus Thorarchaeota archaeon]|nr:MAG: deaminase [Candidatus Thorarchaeota archaeon]